MGQIMQKLPDVVPWRQGTTTTTVTKVNWKIHWPVSLENSLMVAQDFFNSLLIGSVALLWQNAKRNVNPRLSYFEPAGAY